ncbi:hypothetical protein E4U40_006693 [Claviceps sp. LM458 group G5]|nr:hypothetical protein E4U40_006693 [Claviceps sp. LM458 group G5]
MAEWIAQRIGDIEIRDDITVHVPHLSLHKLEGLPTTSPRLNFDLDRILQQYRVGARYLKSD